MLYHITLYYVMLCYITSYYKISHFIILSNIVIKFGRGPRHAIDLPFMSLRHHFRKKTFDKLFSYLSFLTSSEAVRALSLFLLAVIILGDHVAGNT